MTVQHSIIVQTREHSLERTWRHQLCFQQDVWEARSIDPFPYHLNTFADQVECTDQDDMLVILSLVVKHEGICFHAYPQVEGGNHVVLLDFIGGFFSILNTLFYCLVIGDPAPYGWVIIVRLSGVRPIMVTKPVHTGTFCCSSSVSGSTWDVAYELHWKHC